MKSKFTLLLCVLLFSQVQVEARKTWDFSKGYSETTIANLAADATNWTPTTNDAGDYTRFSNATTMSGELYANGVLIEETSGLFFGSLSAKKVNIDQGYTPPRLMLNGTNLSFTLKGLVAGQTITIVTNTANTSSARGISCSSGNATRTAGEETSLEPITNVFVVNEGVDTVDVTFTTGSTGGVHIRSIMIDNGDDSFDPDSEMKIAYLYDSSYSTYCGIDNDPVYNYTVIQEKTCEAIDIKDFTSADVDTIAALSENYDLLVISEAMSSGHAFATSIKSMVNRVPMLNLKSFFYKSSVWGWGAGQNPTSASSAGGVSILDVDTAFIGHDIFKDLVDAENTQIDMFINSDPATIKSNLMQAYICTDVTSLIYNDDVLATVGGYNAIHEHGSSNIYMLIPVSSDAMVVEGENNLTDEALQLINNAVYYLIASKSNVIPVTKPSITQLYYDGYTKVVLNTITSDASIYYTTDGTAPTAASTLYSDTLTFTASCPLNVFAVKQGYDDSSVATDSIVVKTQLASPVITVSLVDVITKQIAITAEEGAAIYYNFSDAVPTTASALYTEPLLITRPCLITAVAVMEGRITSEPASQYVDIEGYVVRNDTLMWADFNTRPTTWMWANSDTSTTDNGDVIKAYSYTTATEEDPTLVPTYTEVDFSNGWKVGTYGQRINLQTMAIATSGNYSPETPADEGATGRCISFLKTNASGEPTTAFIQSTTTYPGPFDLVTFITGAKGASYTELLEVAVSTDNENWTVLDTLSTLGDKYIRKKTVNYDDTDDVYVKISSVSNLGTNSNVLIYDIIVLGEGGYDGVKPAIGEKGTLLSTQLFNLSGMPIHKLEKGLNIVREVYSNGTVLVRKLYIK